MLPKNEAEGGQEEFKTMKSPKKARAKSDKIKDDLFKPPSKLVLKK